RAGVLGTGAVDAEQPDRCAVLVDEVRAVHVYRERGGLGGLLRCGPAPDSETQRDPDHDENESPAHTCSSSTSWRRNCIARVKRCVALLLSACLASAGRRWVAGAEAGPRASVVFMSSVNRDEPSALRRLVDKDAIIDLVHEYSY